MKFIVLHGITALEAWDLGLGAHAKPVEHLDPSASTISASDMQQFLEGLPFLTKPLHILVGSANQRRHSKSWETHLIQKPFPRNSFFDIGNGIFIEAPYMCFALLSGKLPYSHACWLGLELCGRCSTLPFHADAKRIDPKKGYLERMPLTTVNLLRRYATAYGLGEKSMAQRACGIVQDNARSPRECTLHLETRFQPRLGGYGLRNYTLNESIPLTYELANLIGVDKLEADMLWKGLGPRKDGMFALEYDGKDYHADDRQRAYDNIRRSILRYMGVEIVTVDKWQMNDMATFDGIMQMVAESVGGPAVRQDAKARAARIALREEILSPGANPYKLLVP